MKTLEFKDIAGYLPYGLAITHPDWNDRIIIYGGYIDRHEYSLWSGCDFFYENKEYKYHTDYFKPILRPLSDLYKGITHNGKEIIPIVELAKIAYSKIEWKFAIGKFWELGRGCAESNTDNCRFFFWKNEAGPTCYTFVHGYSECKTVYNQADLFDYLDELKIDYRGLIDAGLAIDANTLENNPYK